LVGNFSYFSFEMEVQDGAPCSLKDRLVTTGLGSTSQLLSGIISTGAKFLRISRFSRWGSARLYRTETHTIAWFKVFNLQLDPRKLTE
jgi:hypothetical protein